MELGKGLMHNINKMGNKVIYRTLTEKVVDETWNAVFRTLNVTFCHPSTIIEFILDNDHGMLIMSESAMYQIGKLNYE